MTHIFPLALRPNAGHGLLIHEVFQITHNDAPQSVGLLWTSDQLVAETSTWQHTTLTETNILAPGGIRTHDLSRRAAADLCLRPRGHWDRQITHIRPWRFSCSSPLLSLRYFLIFYYSSSIHLSEFCYPLICSSHILLYPSSHCILLILLLYSVFLILI